MELTNERKDFLLKQLCEYRYDKSNNLKALEKLREKIRELDMKFTEEGYTLAYHSGRIKEENSTLNKLNKRLDENELKIKEAKEKGVEPDVSVLTYDDLHDVVGIRLVCLSMRDVYKFVEIIKDSDLIVLGTKDYIEESKPSGYMSYHMIVEVPVDTPSGQKFVKCEIQLRTIFMDIFAREEHKLSYKGSATEQDKKELKELSDKLYFYDCALNNLFTEKLNQEQPIDSKSSLFECEKVAYLYDIVYDKLNPKIKEFVSNYENSEDVLHITSRIKTPASIQRKLKKKELACTAKNILDNIRDVVGFKLVCIDEGTARDFINYFKSKVEELEGVKITNISDRLEEAKESGYRGYKMNLSYSFPTMIGTQSITVEILIRTMVMDAWALHDDKVFNNESKYSSRQEYENVRRQLRGLSPALRDVEEKLGNIKTGSVPKTPMNLVKVCEEYKVEKERLEKSKKLVKTIG